MASSTSISENVCWGIVGLGDVCQKKSGPAFWKCNGSKLVAVMRRTAGKAKEFAARVPGGQCVGYDNLEEFLQHPNLDAVYVSTRPGTHLDICRKVAAAGKACYVEKPVGRCAQETAEIVNIFQDAGLPLYTAYISRSYDRTQALRRLLRDGVIGDRLERVSYKLVGTGGARDMNGQDIPWRLDAAQSGGGLIMDVGCHVLDRIDYICGPLVDVKGQAQNIKSSTQDVEDYVSLRATIGPSAWAALPSTSSEGALVECLWDFGSNNEADAIDELIFVGPKGSLKMAGMSPNGPIQILDSKGNLVQELNFQMPEHTAQQMIQAVTDNLLVLRREREIAKSNANLNDCISLGDNAIRTQIVLDTVLSSYYGGRESGYWKRVDTWPGRPSQTTR